MMQVCAGALAFLPAVLARPAMTVLAADPARGITLTASLPGSPVDQQPINAAGSSLWIGTPTLTFCPLQAPLCSSYTNSTTVLSCRPDTGAPGACDMTVDVPGGQQFFVRADTGAFGYTQPHSLELPPGAMNSGFTYARNGSGNAGQFGFVDLTSGNTTAVVACPTGTSCDPQTGDGCAPWNVRAALAGTDTTNCLTIQVLTQATNVTAWEYT